MTTALAIAAILVPLLAALGVYLYLNRLGFTVTTISGQPSDGNDQLRVLADWGRVQAEQLRVKSFGLRTLENVELHFKCDSKPVTIEIADPSTLSKAAISTTWDRGSLRIAIPTLPAGEEIKVSLIRVGHYEPIEGRLRGTGGKYKIVRLKLHEAKRSIYQYGIVLLVIWFAPIVVRLING